MILKENTMSENIIRIKNMVCPRCTRAVEKIIESLSIETEKLNLGVLHTKDRLSVTKLAEFETELKKEGFELLTNRKEQTVEIVKLAIIGHFYEGKKKPEFLNFSVWLSQISNVSYSHLSTLFSEQEGVTIEQYIITQRLERAKELLSYGIMSMSEISNELDYRSPQHFSGQFKQIFGISPSVFKKSGRMRDGIA